jgi:hypothetical protein
VCAYLTVQLLLLAVAYHGANVADHLLRWHAGGGEHAHALAAWPRLTACVHATAPVLYSLSLYVALAFYALLWRDPDFHAAAVTPKARATRGINIACPVMIARDLF